MNIMKRNTAKPSKLLQGLMGIKEPREVKRRQALAGDTAALDWLLYFTPETEPRFQLLLDLMAAGVTGETLRSLFVECLIDHPKRIQAATPGSRALLRSLFDYFGPVHITKPPPISTLYRAAAGVIPDVAASGFFWTNELGYALVHAERLGAVLVSAEVRSDEIAAYYSPHQNPKLFEEMPCLWNWVPEVEAVLLEPPQRFEVLEIPAWHLERCQKTSEMRP